MKRGIVADVVVVNSLSVLKLLSTKDDALLFRRNAFLCSWVKEKKKQTRIGERDVQTDKAMPAWTQFLAKMSNSCHQKLHSLSAILALTSSIDSPSSTSIETVLPVRVLTKSCWEPPRRPSA